MQTWQKRYLVLRDSWTDDNDTSLELYACSDADSTGACKCHTVSLRHVMLVDVYHDSKSFPHAFIVFRSVQLSTVTHRIHSSSLNKIKSRPKGVDSDASTRPPNLPSAYRDLDL